MGNRGVVHLHRRGDSYYFRRGIPQDVTNRFQRKEIKVSLGRIQREEAQNVCRLAAVLFDRMVARVRFMDYPNKQEIEALIREDFTERLDKIREIVSDSFGGPGGPGLDLEGELGLIAKALNQDRTRAVQQAYTSFDKERAENLLKKNGLSFEALDPDAQEGACHGLIRSDIELHRIYKAMLEGRYDETEPKDPLLVQLSASGGAAGQTDTEPATTHKLSDLIDKFIKLKSANDWGAKTQLDHKRVLNWFSETVGKDILIHKIDKESVIQFRDFLMDLPSNLAKSKKYEGKTLPEIIDLAGDDPKLSPKTADKYLTMLKGFLNWCRDEEYIPEAPGKKVAVPYQADAKEARLPFSKDALKTLFNSPLYTGCKSIKRRSIPGDNIYKDSRYWIPLVALFTGMRLGEIIQVEVADIVKDEGVRYIDVTDQSSSGATEKTLKTSQSRRRVPIHPELVKLGFLKFVQQQRKAKQTRLFSDMALGTGVDKTNVASKFFNLYFNKIGIKTPKTAFHSFRHNFKDALWHADIPDVYQDALMGHAEGKGAKFTYGSGLPLSKLAQEMKKIKYPLDLSHLIGEASQ